MEKLYRKNNYIKKKIYKDKTIYGKYNIEKRLY